VQVPVCFPKMACVPQPASGASPLQSPPVRPRVRILAAVASGGRRRFETESLASPAASLHRAFAPASPPPSRGTRARGAAPLDQLRIRAHSVRSDRGGDRLHRAGSACEQCCGRLLRRFRRGEANMLLGKRAKTVTFSNIRLVYLTAAKTTSTLEKLTHKSLQAEQK